ncbi:MAG: SDR family oxidoreductase [Deltaproteobacteria bacterium]|nr:SDR family oxidoreductase [Deltaproteobacteria bacterium]MBW2361623.1 SDR family oxidoreductase [Deltaproteobacteria bacterium]
MTTQSITELFDLSGKGALVTGGALGIGQAISFRLAEAGAAVLIADVNLDAAKQTVQEIESRGGRAQAIAADVSSGKDAERAVQTAADAFGRLDILVNNAGIFPLVPVLDVDEATWDRVIDINLKGSFLFAQAAGRQMAADGRGGKIINIASVDGIHPNGVATHYNASKGGVIMLTKALALELAPHQILVNAVAPGGIATPGGENARTQVSETTGVPAQAMVDGWLARVPLRRMGEPDDIAKVVFFLASGAADFVSGEIIVTDGGYLLS